MIDVKELEERIERNKLALRRLESKYLIAYCPKEPAGTSYSDVDSIHGSKKEYRIEEYFKEKQRLQAIIDLDEELVITSGIRIDDEGYLELLENNLQRVKYLRTVKGYTQEKTANILKLGLRTVQRIEKELKMA